MTAKTTASGVPYDVLGDMTDQARRDAAMKGFVREFFECAECSHLWEWEVPDPIEHAAGWIAGELKPPQ